MVKADGSWHTEKIQTGHIEKRPTRLANVRRFFHEIMPGIVKPPKDREYLHTESGRIIPLHARIASAEGVRFYGSVLPLPAEPGSDQLDSFDDPLAVEIGLGVGPNDIPPEGWPKDFKPEVANRILGYLPEADL